MLEAEIEFVVRDGLAPVLVDVAIYRHSRRHELPGRGATLSGVALESTRTVRNIPTCIHVGPAEGLDRASVATFDNLAAVPTSVLTAELGGLGVGGRQ
jgi:hypothetical protein